MKIAAVLGAGLASVALFAGPVSAKDYACVPIEGNPLPMYHMSCDAGSCHCDSGFALVDPTESLLTIQNEDSSGSSSKASGS